MELELKVDSNSMKQLLHFLTGGFNGGTDVDKPLELSLKRLGEKEWNQVPPLAASDNLRARWLNSVWSNLMAADLQACWLTSVGHLDGN